MAKGVAIFDLSETLINLDDLWNNAFISLLEELGIKMNEELSGVLTNSGYDSACSYLMDYYRVPYSHSDLLRKLAHNAISRFHNEITLKDGALEFINILRNRNYRTVVLASGNPLIMQMAKNHFKDTLIMDEWINTREIQSAKNEPELYRNLADKYKVPLDSCYLFEDIEEVIKSANKAGIKTIYIGEGNSSSANYSSTSFVELCSCPIIE